LVAARKSENKGHHVPIPKNETELKHLQENIQWYTDKINQQSIGKEIFTNLQDALKGVEQILEEDFEISKKELSSIDNITHETFREIMVGCSHTIVTSKIIFNLFFQIREARKNLITLIHSPLPEIFPCAFSEEYLPEEKKKILLEVKSELKFSGVKRKEESNKLDEFIERNINKVISCFYLNDIK
jgi:hypothetical protein